MRIIAKRTLRGFWAVHADAEQPLKAWHETAKAADWQTPADVKAAYPKASVLPNDRIRFEIGGNKYRLIVMARYDLGILFIRFVGTHAQYDRIDATTV